jgi:hypothetical protein
MRVLVGRLGLLVAVAVSTLPARSPEGALARARTEAAGDPIVIGLSGTVTAADKGTYQEHGFEVPAGVSRIDVEFAYDGRGAGTELEIGLFDPRRFRGTSRFSKDRVHQPDLRRSCLLSSTASRAILKTARGRRGRCGAAGTPGSG